jgi:hypothetical protein
MHPMKLGKLSGTAVLLGAALVVLPAPARGDDLACGLAENGTIVVDGLTDDWRGVEGLKLGNGDFSALVRCNIDDHGLFLLVEVTDKYVVRTAKAVPGEDHVELTISGKKIIIHPTDGRIKEKMKLPKGVKGIKLASSLEEDGWSVELGIPLGRLPGYAAGVPQLDFDIRVADCNAKAQLKTERTLDSKGALTFAQGAATLEAFMRERRLKPSDIYWQKSARLGHQGAARIVLAKKTLAVISDEYVFMDVPFGKEDVKDARLVDLAGDRRDALVVRYAEKGGGGAREVLAVYRPLSGGQISRMFAIEVAKSHSGSRLDTKVSFVKHGKATDLVLEAQPAVGFSAQTFQEQAADDMIPILLPWSDDRRARYEFRGDEYQRSTK